MTHMTCEERIDEYLKSALEDLRTATEQTYEYECDECGHTWIGYFEYEDCPDCASDLASMEERDMAAERDTYMEGVLEITPQYVVYRVGLSTGGPADGFTLHVDPNDHAINGAEYYFQDWFDGATRNLVGDALQMVRDMFEPYVQPIE